MPAPRTGAAVLALILVLGLMSAFGVPAAADAAGVTRYVAGSGADSPGGSANDCTTLSAPCATIQHAIDEAASGDTVSVASGTYNEALVITKAITLSGAGSGTTIIDGQGLSPSSGALVTIGPLAGNGAVTVSGFTLDNGGGAQNPPAVGISLTGDAASSTTIANNQISGFFVGLLHEGIGSPTTISNNQFTGLLSSTGAGGALPAIGIHLLSDAADTLTDAITNNTFSGYAGYGVKADAGSSTNPTGNINTTITNNVFQLGGDPTFPAADQPAAIALSSAASSDTFTATLGSNSGTVVAPTTVLTTMPAPGGTISTPGHATDTITVGTRFSDVAASNPFATDIDQLASEGIFQGFADGTFHPVDPVNREQFAALVSRVLDVPNTTGPCAAKQNRFTDVANSSPFCKSINFLNQQNIVQGYTNGNFEPNAPINRQSIAAFLERTDSWLRYGRTSAAASDAPCTSPTPFSDVSAHNMFCGDIEFAASSGITVGDTDGAFHPANSTLRQEVAAFLIRFQNYDQKQLSSS